MMSAHIQQAGLLSGRSMTMMAVIGLHALVISALIAIRVVPELIEPDPPAMIVVPVIDPVDPVPSEPRSASPSKTLIFIPEVVIPVPGELQWSTPEVPDSSAGGDTSLVMEATTGASTVPPAVRTSTDLQFQIVRSADEYYPSTSVMLEEHGTAVVRVCVDAGGRIEGQPTIQSSAGHRRLDAAALRWARESLRFTPATVDGMAVAACKGFRVNFALR